MFVKTRMTTNPITVTSETSIAEAYGLVKENKIRRLPVVDNGKLVGIVTEKELQQLTPSKATTLSIYEVNYLLAKTKVKSAMSKDVIITTPDTLLEEAAVSMRENNVSALPVVDNGKIVGIITETDIFDAFTDLLGAREYGSRITVIADDSPGVLAKIANIMGDFGVNIIRLAVYRSESDKSRVVIRINSVNTENIEKTLEDSGYPVVHVSKNIK
ncbi:MAG: CBS and ACT domain-containing protein [Clostridiales bacterium]